MTKINFEPTLKQAEAYMYLTDDVHREIGFGGGAGGGKALASGNKILTDHGWKKVKDVKLTDRLVAVDGTYTNIVAIMPQGITKNYKITFDDGVTCEVNKDHLWTVKSSKHGYRDGWIVRSTEFLFKAKDNYSIPLLRNPAPGDYVSNYDPYILGYIIGNGCMTGAFPTIYTTDVEITKYLKKNKWTIHQYKPNVYQCHLAIKEEYEKVIKEIGMYSKQQKHIPNNLLNAIPEQRIALLQGLMDSDGTCGKDGSCSYSTVVQKLAEDVVYLVRSLGGKSSIERKKRIGGSGEFEGGYKGKYNELDIRVSHCNNFTPFRLKRKLDRVKKAKYLNRYIRNIEPIEDGETICFSIEHPEKMFVIQGFIVTHNSYLGCFWLFSQALKYAGTTWLLGRRELTNIKRTTLISFFKLIQDLGLQPKDLFNFNQQNNTITFYNNSRIVLMDLSYQPSDPLYTRLGGLELTGAFVDESNELPEKAIEILKSRIGRGRNKEYNILPKILETFNPSKNHVYDRYYLPYKNSELPEHRVFIPSLATDNAHLDDNYIEQLKNLNEVSRQRLLYGNFEYDDDPQKIFDYECIVNSFSNEFVPEGTKYITADIALQGSDKLVIMVWSGWRVIKIISRAKSEADEVIELIQKYATEYNVPRSNIVYDSDGIGNYIGAFLKGCKPFVNNAAPIQPHKSQLKANPMNKLNYRNLKSQCYFEFARKVNSNEIFINCKDINMKNEIIQELERVRSHNIDKDTTLQVEPKDLMKEAIGRSPDMSDALMMRMYFELKPRVVFGFV